MYYYYYYLFVKFIIYLLTYLHNYSVMWFPLEQYAYCSNDRLHVGLDVALNYIAYTFQRECMKDTNFMRYADSVFLIPLRPVNGCK